MSPHFSSGFKAVGPLAVTSRCGSRRTRRGLQPVPSECVCELCAIKKSHTYVVVRLP